MITRRLIDTSYDWSSFFGSTLDDDPEGPIKVGATRLFLLWTPSSLSDSLAPAPAATESRLPSTLPDTDDVALCSPPCVLAGVWGGVLMGGVTIEGAVFIAVARGT